ILPKEKPFQVTGCLPLFGLSEENARSICEVSQRLGIAAVVHQEGSEVPLVGSNRPNPAMPFLALRSNTCYSGLLFVYNPSRDQRKSYGKRFRPTLFEKIAGIRAPHK